MCLLLAFNRYKDLYGYVCHIAINITYMEDCTIVLCITCSSEALAEIIELRKQLNYIVVSCIIFSLLLYNAELKLKHITVVITNLNVAIILCMWLYQSNPSYCNHAHPILNNAKSH